MSEINPYQSPLTDSQRKPDTPEVAVWREGGTLIMHRDATLPLICVKTGTAADRTIALQARRSFTLDEGCTIHVPVCREWRRRRLRLNCIGAMLLFVLVGSPFAIQRLPFWLTANGWFLAASLIAAVIILLILSAISSAARLVSVDRKSRDCVYLTGACEDFLKHFPEWPR